MNNASRPRGPLDSRWWTRPRIICITLLLLLAAYIYAQPSLERWLGVELPVLVENPNPELPPAERSDPDGSAGDDAVHADQPGLKLEPVGRDTWRSPAGLVWGPGPGQHRIQHVMRHCHDDPSRPVHGVFNVTHQDEVLGLIDQAWQIAGTGAGDKVRKKQSGERTEYTITMPQTVGYVGGRQGGEQGQPQTDRIRLVTQGNRVITAYPVWP